MSTKLMYATLIRITEIADNNVGRPDIENWYKFAKQSILDDKFLTDDEKSEAIRRLTSLYDMLKICFNVGTKRVCENCQLECLATSFCEFCIRSHLKAKFSCWTSGNDEIDNLIQKCQMESISPMAIIEWIPYKNFRNVEYLTKGGCSEIYTADWIGGGYCEWDSKNLLLKRNGTFKLILKRLENVERANRSWFEEVCNLN